MVFSVRNTSRPISSIAPTACMSIAFTLILMFSMLLAPYVFPGSGQGFSSIAYAETSAEVQAESDMVVQRLDEFQAELTQINAEYEAAVTECEYAKERLNVAQRRSDEAQRHLHELQSQLSELTAPTYQSAPASFLGYLFGSQSFTDFVAAFETYSRLSSYNAQLIAEAKIVRAEAEAMRIDYAILLTIAQEKEEAVKALRDQAEATAAEMQSEIDALQEQVAELLAQEFLASEAGRLRALEQTRASNAGYIDPAIRARVPALTHPCPGYIMIFSYYGARGSSFHQGVDFAADYGTPVYAAASGTVTDAGYQSSMGNYIIISHENGVRTIYMHASKLYVSAGTWVTTGQLIMTVGSTGNSEGPHLHFQIDIDRVTYNPLLFL